MIVMQDKGKIIHKGVCLVVTLCFYISHGQNNYAYLITSEVIVNLNANQNSLDIRTDLGNIGRVSYRATATRVGDTYFDFFYLPNNFTKATLTGRASAVASSDHPDCQYSEIQEELKKDFGNASIGFDGCSMIQSVYPIHIFGNKDQLNNGVCINDVIQLKYGYQWQFQLDSGNWIDFPPRYNNKSVVTFTLKTILEESRINVDGHNIIRFRTGYNNQFTNIISYNIFPCPPEIVQIDTKEARCSYSKDGSFTLNLSRDLSTPREELVITLYDKTNNAVIGQEFTKSLVDNGNNSYGYTWLGNLDDGNYSIRYQTHTGSGGIPSSDISWSVLRPADVTIKAPQQVSFRINDVGDENCYAINDGYIEVSATGESGRTFFYQYRKNGQVQVVSGRSWIPFTSSTRISGLGKASYRIQVRDSSNCYAK